MVAFAAIRDAVGPHAGGDVVGAVGGVQEGLGARVDVVAVEQQAADLRPQGGAARLAGHEDLGALGPEGLGEDAGLGGLADAVAPFEGEEEARAVGGVPRGRGGDLAHAASVVAGRRCSSERPGGPGHGRTLRGAHRRMAGKRKMAPWEDRSAPHPKGRRGHHEVR